MKMGNIFAVTKPILHCLMKSLGMISKLVEIEPATNLHFWVPTINSTKPAVLFLHGFIANGIFTWLFQVLSLTSSDVYVPDLLFFRDSFTVRPECSTSFQVMFANPKEKEELLEALVVIMTKKPLIPLTTPSDCRKLGETAILEYIKGAGHLVQIERPCSYNSHLKKFLSDSSDPQICDESIFV